MTKNQQAAIVGLSAALGWLATQKVREGVPGAGRPAAGALALHLRAVTNVEFAGAGRLATDAVAPPRRNAPDGADGGSS